MNSLLNRIRNLFTGVHKRRSFLILFALAASLLVVTVVLADIPDRRTPANTLVPNPGTQEQELANITFPAPYNVFEFVVTCAACHGGSIDQQAGHFGNWAGTAMASAMRDPVFRANQQIVNETIKTVTGEDGAGNICIRCHSPNAWYSGRTDPLLNGSADASNAIHSIVLSTDDEGILCEYCHRSIGNVEMMRADLDPADPVWNMLAGLTDWPHAGAPYPYGPVAGDPYGDATMQLNDGMTYAGKYSGSVDIFFSDTPLPDPATGLMTTYTGQTYGVYPPGFPNAGEPVISPDGSIPIHFELPIGPPTDPTTGLPDYQAQSVSLEHPTVTGQDFVTTSEFCGTCHDLSIPVLDHGMPEQRTYTEWKYSDFGANDVRCQDCHMPTMKQEYADDAQVSLNPDPALAGWFPYGKDRNPDGGTAFHKFGGANRDLPDMMKILYPEVDLEVIGAPTGNDTRIFPGMLSDRSTMWDRAQRNTELSLEEAVDTSILSPLTEVAPGIYEFTVKVTNTTGHRIPSGYPDGRQLWLGVRVTDAIAGTVYESGYWNPNDAYLYTDSAGTPLTLAQDNVIDATQGNEVMVYAKLTAFCNPYPRAGQPGFTIENCSAPTPHLINNVVVFDNRIPPAGFDPLAYEERGAKFVTFDPATYIPTTDMTRFPAGQNWDEVTYRFAAEPNLTGLNVRVEAYWQTHTRDFMEYLADQNTSTYRPEGPPSILDPNYPLTPNYLSDQFANFGAMTRLDGVTSLNDNWGGIAYAAWLETGKGAPYLVASADSSQGAAPAAPDAPLVTGIDPFSVQIDWLPVDGADGYIVWIRYGLDETETTASWDRLAVVYGTSLVNDAMNVSKTYGFRIQAFNGAGYSVFSPVVNYMTPTDLPLPPENLQVVSVVGPAVTLSWFDVADNEDGFIIQRQDVVNGVPGLWYDLATVPSQTAGGASGGNSYVDTATMPSATYNYRVAAYNAFGNSTWTLPATASTGGIPGAPVLLSAVAINGNTVDLAWSPGTGIIHGYIVERSTDGVNFPTRFQIADPLAAAFTDTTVIENTDYWYRVKAYNGAGESAPSNVLMVRTPAPPPRAPDRLTAEAPVFNLVNLSWRDRSNDEEGFFVERSEDGATFAQIAILPANTTAYADNTVQGAMTYWYRVQAFNSGGLSVSDYSNVAIAVTPSENVLPPAVPSELAALANRNRVDLSWVDNSLDEFGFHIYRSTDGVNFTLYATVGSNVTSYRDRNVTRRATYYYYVTAYNAAPGESQPTNTIAVTIP